MKPVTQTQFGKGEGNCMAACVASILELPIEQVPNFALLGHDWAQNMEDWLAQQGYDLISILFENEDALMRSYLTPNRVVMVSGVSPRAESGDVTFRHVVVAHTVGRGVHIVHDPHPSGAGILMTHDVWVRFVVPLQADLQRAMGRQP